MQTRALGATGLEVSVLGLGAGALGEARLDEAAAARLLHEAVDLGVTLLDTAPSYGASEARIGRHLGAHRRARVVLSTKVGYGVAGVEDWTGESVRLGVDAALARLCTDVLDVVHLHSCPRWLLERGEVVRALEDARLAGKVRVAAYSGEDDALDFALSCGVFGCVQVSVNVCDQRALSWALPRASAAGLGVIAKRPLANAAWTHLAQGAPAARPDVAEYLQRYRALAGVVDEAVSSGVAASVGELALRFAAFAPGVASCLVGTTRVERLAQNAAALARGPLPDEVLAALRARFAACDAGWTGVV